MFINPVLQYGSSASGLLYWKRWPRLCAGRCRRFKRRPQSSTCTCCFTYRVYSGCHFWEVDLPRRTFYLFISRFCCPECFATVYSFLFSLPRQLAQHIRYWKFRALKLRLLSEFSKLLLSCLCKYSDDNCISVLDFMCCNSVVEMLNTFPVYQPLTIASAQIWGSPHLYLWCGWEEIETTEGEVHLNFDVQCICRFTRLSLKSHAIVLLVYAGMTVMLTSDRCTLLLFPAFLILGSWHPSVPLIFTF